MAERPVNSYIDRSRHDRRIELAKLARDRHADVSVVMGLSWKLKGHQAHIDYTGGLDTGKLQQNLASWGNLRWGRATAAEDGIKVPKTSVEVADKLNPAQGRHDPSSWKDTLMRVAPVDLQRRAVDGRAGETAEAHNPRIRAENEQKSSSFAAVLARVDTVAMAHLARNHLEERRRRQSPSHGLDPLALPQVSKPFFGTGHVFYVIQFRADGRRGDMVQWIMKIPAAASEDGTWDELQRETLRTETFLLHKLSTETKVPVPEIIDADCQADNEIHAPWLLMEFVQGRRLEDIWFDQDVGGGVNPYVLRERREKILRNVADAMLQLGRYDFDQGGAPLFDQKHGNLVGTRSLRELDIQAMVDRWFADEAGGNTSPVYAGVGPWDNTTAMYTAMLDAYPPVTVTERGMDELLRLLISHVRESGRPRPRAWPSSSPRGVSKTEKEMKEEERKKKEGEKTFVLTHPDLSMRNILLAEDGTTIKAILGWDGVRATPRSLGNEALPRWLVRDFNPFAWRWQPAADFWRRNHVQPEGNRFEDPPWVLQELREYYANTVRVLKRKSGTSHDDEDVDLTRQSLLTLTLDAAIRDPRCRIAALRRVMEKCSRSFEELNFDMFVDTLGEGYKVDASKLKCLANNIRELIDKGFVKGAVIW